MYTRNMNNTPKDAGESYAIGWNDAVRFKPRKTDYEGLFVSAYETGYNDGVRSRER